MHELQSECDKMLRSLNEQKSAYEREPYLPGKTTVQAGEALMLALTIPTNTDAFYTALEDEQDNYRDFKESYEYLRDFFNGGQIKNFREAHAAVELYKNNQSQIHDDEVKKAADAMSKILAMAEPYEKIRTLSTLRSEFMDKYNALKAQEIAPAKDYVAGCYDRILQYLDTDQCKQRFQSAVEAERDAAVSKVENVQNLNDLVLLKADANTNKIQWFNKIDDYKNAQQPVVPTPSPSSNQGGTAPAPVQPTPVVRRRVTVSIQDVTPASWQINTTAELDDYIEKLRRALEQKLSNGDTLNVDIW